MARSKARRWTRGETLLALGLAATIFIGVGSWYYPAQANKRAAANFDFEETKAGLDALSDRIADVDNWVLRYEAASSPGSTAYRENVTSAREFHRAAYSNWTTGNHHEARLLITQSNAHLDAIPDPTGKGGVPGWVWFLIVILVVALSVGVVAMSGKKREPDA